jgi:hypothetical protein
LFWYAEVTFTQTIERYGRTDVSQKTKKFEFYWCEAPLQSPKPLVFILTPFLNIYWRYCVYNHVVDKLKRAGERGKFENHYQDKIEINRGCGNDLSFNQALTIEDELQVIESAKKGLGEAVYFLPIALLLVTFFISGG